MDNSRNFLTQGEVAYLLRDKIKKRPANPVYPTENVVNIYDESILWYKIPGFPSYEISNNGYLRSFKSAYKYPYGTILNYYHKNGNYFILTDKNNSRYKLTVDDIWNIINKSTEKEPPVFGYQVMVINPRNQRFMLLPNKPNDDPELEAKRVKSYKSRSIKIKGDPCDYTKLYAPSINVPDIPLEK